MHSLGYIGGVFISLTLVPQIAHTLRKKRVDQLSPLFLVVSYIGTVLMLIYAIQENLVPVIVTDSMILFFLTILSFLFIKFRRAHTDIHVSDTDPQTRNVQTVPPDATA